MRYAQKNEDTIDGLRKAGRGRDSCSPGKLSVPRGHQQLFAVALPWDQRLKGDDNGIVERVFWTMFEFNRWQEGAKM